MRPRRRPESTAHAAGRPPPRRLAVDASEQAVKVEKARPRRRPSGRGRPRLASPAAREAAAAETEAKATGEEAAGWDRNVRWDTEEEARIPAATRALLDAATAPGASTQVVLDKGRRAARPHHRRRVDQGGSRQGARSPATRSCSAPGSPRRTLAAGQDNRARVWHLVDTLPDGQEKTAARVPRRCRRRRGDLPPDPRVPAQDRRRPPGDVADLASNPGPALYAAAEALAGTAQEAHEFLRDGQYVARAADARVEIARVMDAGGPEVKAAAQVALAGPASYGWRF